MPVCSYHHGYILDSRGDSIGSYVIDSNVYVPNAGYIASCSYLSALFQSKSIIQFDTVDNKRNSTVKYHKIYRIKYTS